MNNNFVQILMDICNVCLVPILAVLTGYIVTLIKQKTNEISNNVENEKIKSYINMLGETITNCVIATNQTYVESLKNKNIFSAEEQKVAFQKTLDAVNAILTDEARTYLSMVYKDLDSYIAEVIESKVNALKQPID